MFIRQMWHYLALCAPYHCPLSVTQKMLAKQSGLQNYELGLLFHHQHVQDLPMHTISCATYKAGFRGKTAFCCTLCHRHEQ